MVGIDEAGRGCAAGPLVVTGLKLLNKVEELNDSKKLSKKKRESLFSKIKENSNTCIISISSKEIDEKGISKCMFEALTKIKEYFKGEKLLFDGNTSYGVEGIETMIKADGKVPEVSAASIIAKVTKDKELDELAEEYPMFSFKSHGGYLTKKHVEEIREHGRTPIHRFSYKIKALDESS